MGQQVFAEILPTAPGGREQVVWLEFSMMSVAGRVRGAAGRVGVWYGGGHRELLFEERMGTSQTEEKLLVGGQTGPLRMYKVMLREV